MKFIKANGLIHENNIIYKTSYRENTGCLQAKHTRCCAQNVTSFSCESRSSLGNIACTRFINGKRVRVRFIKIRCLSKSSKEE